MRAITRCLIAVLLGGIVPSHAFAQDASLDWWERIRFSGDIRIRHEAFFQEAAPTRTRFRFRFRLGLTSQINPDWRVGFRVASGNADNITSTNQSFDGLFDGKSVSINRAYVQFAPASFLGSNRPILSFTGGKFSPQHFKPSAGMGSELVLDGDVTVEGFHEAVGVLRAGQGLLRRIDLHADQWVLDEVGSGPDAWMFGGQGVVTLGLDSSRTTLTLAGGVMHYRRPDLIAQAGNSNDQLVISNGVRLQDGSVVDGGVPFKPTASNPIIGFLNGFTILRGAAEFVMRPRGASRPFGIFVDVAHNTEAVRDNDAIWVGASWGELRRSGDIRLAAAFARAEKESTVSALSYSDFGRSGGTNVQGLMLQIEVRAARGVTMSAKDHLVTQIRSPAGQPSPSLHRLQLNTAVSF